MSEGVNPLEQEEVMSDKHVHTWQPVTTILTGSLVLYYDCRCSETISVADYKRYGLDDIDDSPHPQIGPGVNVAMLYHPPAKAGEALAGGDDG